VLNALHCVDVGPVRLLFAAPSVDCRSNEYEHAFIWLMTIAIVFVLGFPIALLIVLRVNRRAVMQTVLLRGRENGNGVVTFAAQPEKDKRSNKLSLHEAESSSTLLEMEIVGDAVDKAAIASFALKLGPSFAMYSAHAACWWGPLLLLRRLAFVFVSVFLSGSRQTVLQPTLFAALSLTSLLGHFTVQPFHARRLNLLEGTCTSLLAYLSLILAAEPPPFSAFWQVILALLLMVPTSLMLIVVVYEFVRARLRQLRAVAKRRRKERAARIGGSEPRVSPHSTRGGAPSRSVYGSTADASPGALYYEPPSSDDGVAAGTPTSHHSLNGGDDVLHVDVPEEFKEEDEDREARL
jgi:hypothetical protein